MSEQKPHLSPTQLDMYARCGEQYRRRYVEGEILPPGITLVTGKAFHAGAEMNFRQKIESHEDLPASEIVDAAVAGFEAETKGGVALTPDEAARGKDVTLGEAKDQTAKLAKLHAELQAPDYQPEFVEQRVRIELPNAPRDILGFIDLADVERRVIDFKTAAKKKPQSEVETSTQLTYYAAAYQAMTGEPASEVRLDTVVKNKNPERQVLSATRDHADFQVLSNRINATLQGLEAGVFAPAPVGAWWCNAKWCGYAASCPYYNAERNGNG